MSEVGKLFDRMLDYKFKEEWEKIRKEERTKWAELGSAIVEEITSKYLEPIKEKKGLYDFNVICDKIEHITLECKVDNTTFQDWCDCILREEQLKKARDKFDKLNAKLGHLS